MTTDDIEVTGAPIIYSKPYVVHDSLGSFQETMLPGVVSEILGTCDCRFLVNHSRDMIPLARTASRTLRLSDGPDALRFSATLDKRQSLANDLAVAIERGDISQMSVGFVVGKDSWSDDYSSRTIRSIADLLDLSAVTYPASPTTSIGLTNGNGTTTNSARPPEVFLGVPLHGDAAARSRMRTLVLQSKAGQR
jgi:HK97 family phage prohead protease